MLSATAKSLSIQPERSTVIKIMVHECNSSKGVEVKKNLGWINKFFSKVCVNVSLFTIYFTN